MRDQTPLQPLCDVAAGGAARVPVGLSAEAHARNLAKRNARAAERPLPADCPPSSPPDVRPRTSGFVGRV